MCQVLSETNTGMLIISRIKGICFNIDPFFGPVYTLLAEVCIFQSLIFPLCYFLKHVPMMEIVSVQEHFVVMQRFAEVCLNQ